MVHVLKMELNLSWIIFYVVRIALHLGGLSSNVILEILDVNILYKCFIRAYGQFALLLSTYFLPDLELVNRSWWYDDDNDDFMLCIRIQSSISRCRCFRSR